MLTSADSTRLSCSDSSQLLCRFSTAGGSSGWTDVAGGRLLTPDVIVVAGGRLLTPDVIVVAGGNLLTPDVIVVAGGSRRVVSGD